MVTNKELETLKSVAEHNIKIANEEIAKYEDRENPKLWISDIRYWEGIKVAWECSLIVINGQIDNAKQEKVG